MHVHRAWIIACASPDQISKIKADDKLPLTLVEIDEQVDARYKQNAFFEDMKTRSWTPLCNDVWSGIVQFGLRSLGFDVNLSPEEDLLTRVAFGATLSILFLSSEFLANQDQPAESKAVQFLTEDYQKRCVSPALFFLNPPETKTRAATD